MESKKKVVVGMSGGVDSAVSALLLKDLGYDVVGLFMHNWEEEEGGVCTSADDWEDARNVAAAIGIPIYSINFAKEYLDRVFSYFLDEYKAGRTPNPDVLCNREIKFDAFSDYAHKLGADYIATGHYCDIAHDVDTESGKTTYLLTAADAVKDQTYFLNQVSAEQLKDILFPLGKLTKGQVRKIAEERNLTAVAKKKDSTGICFIGERKFKQFLMQYLPARPGNIVDMSGNIIGKHDGLMYYTLGQRRGLGIGGLSGYAAERWFVVEKHLPTNELVVSCGEDDILFTDALFTPHINFIGDAPKTDVFECLAKTRYRQPSQKCTVKMKDGGAEVIFEESQRAVTPGQFVVFYLGNRCLGGGVIDRAYNVK